jgi:hypothetical protein
MFEPIECAFDPADGQNAPGNEKHPNPRLRKLESGANIRSFNLSVPAGRKRRDGSDTDHIEIQENLLVIITADDN